MSWILTLWGSLAKFVSSPSFNLLLTFLLVAITGFYAWAAYKTWKEMRNANSAVVTAKIEPLGVAATVIRVTNLGNTAAFDVKMSYKVHPEGPKSNWYTPILERNDFARLWIKYEGTRDGGISLVDLAKKFKKAEIDLSYTDVYKQTIERTITVDLEQLNQAFSENLWLMDTSLKEDVEEISKSIKKISNAMFGNEFKVAVTKVPPTAEEKAARMAEIKKIQRRAQQEERKKAKENNSEGNTQDTTEL